MAVDALVGLSTPPVLQPMYQNHVLYLAPGTTRASQSQPERKRENSGAVVIALQLAKSPSR